MQAAEEGDFDFLKQFKDIRTEEDVQTTELNTFVEERVADRSNPVKPAN